MHNLFPLRCNDRLIIILLCLLIVENFAVEGSRPRSVQETVAAMKTKLSNAIDDATKQISLSLSSRPR